MIPRGRKLPVLLFALFVFAVMAGGWTFYNWHQTRYGKYSEALHLHPPDSQPLGSDIARSTTSTAQIIALASSSPTNHDESITEIDQGVVEIDNDIYSMVSEAIRNDFPELNLSQSDLLDLSETIVQLRDALGKLRNTERTDENFSTFRQLEDIRDNAIWDFERITGMSLQEFFLRAPTEGGLDNEKFDDEGIILEPLSNYQP
jgi:hypothetical protein